MTNTDTAARLSPEIEKMLDQIEELYPDVMWLKLYPKDLDGDHVLFGNWLRQTLHTLETKHRAEVEELNESKNHTIKNMMEEIRYLSSSQPERRKPVIRIKSGDTWYIPMITQAIDTPDGLFVEADLDLTTTTSESHHE